MCQALDDISAAFTLPLVAIGEKLGPVKAMAHPGPVISREVPDRAGITVR